MDEKKIKKKFLIFVGISILITLLGLSLSKGLYLVGILFAMILVLSYFTYLKMIEILNTQELLKLKNTKLQNSSKYKSEFLANMSHELRTPLNSLLILASDLAANKEKNLTSGQIESAKIIESGGHDLLVLINDILDLSKIEAGKMRIVNEEINLNEVCRKVENLFRPLVTQKNLKFVINVDKDCPEIFWSDSLRLNQILNNLLGNAIKFTDRGQICLTIFIPKNIPKNDFKNDFIAFSITDTGLGIAEEKQKDIFEAFYQGDGSTTRRYGGTGLGLSISLALAKLMGGDISLESKLGLGSTFSLCLPQSMRQKDEIEKLDIISEEKTITQKEQKSINYEIRTEVEIDDDRDHIAKTDKVVLVVEDDYDFARNLILYIRERGMKTLHASNGIKALDLIKKNRLDFVFLDMKLPELSGYHVLEKIKSDLFLRNIPVCVMSSEKTYNNTVQMGAFAFLEKPIQRDYLEKIFMKVERFWTKTKKELLVVENDLSFQKRIDDLLGGDDLRIIPYSDPAKALHDLLERKKEDPIDGLILDYNSPNLNGDLFLKTIYDHYSFLPPIIVITKSKFSRLEELKIRKFTGTIILKDEYFSELLIDEISLLLHRPLSVLSQEKIELVKKRHSLRGPLDKKKILVVDDDVRTVFAISKIFTEQGSEVLKASDGTMALEVLAENSDVGLIILDLKMPLMDGYELMKQIRNSFKFQTVPIIVVTAKTMSEDYNKCIENGANDFLNKPIDSDQILLVSRVWLQGGRF